MKESYIKLHGGSLIRKKNYLIENSTESEDIIFGLLEDLKYRFVFQKAFLTDRFSIVDFYLPKPYFLCIEIDGKYHEDENQIKKDRIRESYLTKTRRMRLLRITNEKVNLMSKSDLKKEIEGMLIEPRGSIKRLTLGRD